LYYSGSKTSMGMLAIAAFLGFTYNRISLRYRPLLIPLGVILLCSIASYASIFVNDTAALALDPTAFTGRGQIWAALFKYAQNNMLLGAGFSSFWNIGGDSPIFSYAHGYTTTVTVGHNGYLDLLITLGLPGVLLVMVSTLLWPIIKVATADRVEFGKGALLCSILLFCAGHNVTESSLFERDSFVGLIAVFAAACAAFTLNGSQSGGRSKARGAGEDLMKKMRQRQQSSNQVAP